MNILNVIQNTALIFSAHRYKHNRVRYLVANTRNQLTQRRKLFRLNQDILCMTKFLIGRSLEFLVSTGQSPVFILYFFFLGLNFPV